MTTSTIPYTPTAPGWSSIRPRPLGSVRPYPGPTATPAVPTPRPPVFHTCRLTTHLVPAAYPRLTPDVPLPEIPAHTPGESRDTRRDRAEVLVNEVLETQDAHMEGRLAGEPNQKLYWNCVNRYVRTSGRAGGITLFLAPANGFHKETWEPMLQSLLDMPGGKTVDEVWAWDAVQHGDAAVVNAGNESGIFDWLDNTRDIANFLLHYLPEEVESAVLPTRLARLPASTAGVRARDGYHTRRLVVVGHSFGGCTALRAAIDFPKLFSSFVLVDPVIHRFDGVVPGRVNKKVLGAFTRRDRWPSREDALKVMTKSPFFGAWHPAVLRAYVDYALTDDPEGGVRLKMSGLQEGLSFANRVPGGEMWELLERVDEGIALRWIVPDQSWSESTKQLTYEKVWRRRANASNIVFHFAGHLIVQEAPVELARDVSDFLLREHGGLRGHL